MFKILQYYNVISNFEHIFAILNKEQLFKLVSPGLEPGTFRVESERDDHYTTKPDELYKLIILKFSSYEIRDVTADIVEVC